MGCIFAFSSKKYSNYFVIQLPYFYEPHISSSNTSFVLSEDTSRHCIQVLRMHKDGQVQLTDGAGNLYTAAITKADKKRCEVNIQLSAFSVQPVPKICVAISLLKNSNRFEWFLEKATEMGICEIIPLLCERTERQHFRYDRMQNIVVSAMLQSRQSWLPGLHQPTSLQQAATQSSYVHKLIAHCVEDVQKITLNTLTNNGAAQILIGPEGDFTAGEISFALQQGYQPVSLGNTRLRTETAGVVASALLIHLH